MRLRFIQNSGSLTSSNSFKKLRILSDFRLIKNSSLSMSSGSLKILAPLWIQDYYKIPASQEISVRLNTSGTQNLSSYALHLYFYIMMHCIFCIIISQRPGGLINPFIGIEHVCDLFREIRELDNNRLLCEKTRHICVKLNMCMTYSGESGVSMTFIDSYLRKLGIHMWPSAPYILLYSWCSYI